MWSKIILQIILICWFAVQVKKKSLLLSMLKTVVLNIFGNSNIFFQDSLMNKAEKDSNYL